MNTEFYIRQPVEGEDLFAQLQQQSLDRLQRLCGKIWTDYNVHDPGVTICDLLNYALTELDYRLRFGLPDYLTDEETGFVPARYGLFPLPAVFPVQPVTPADYRKWMVDQIREIGNLWIYPVRGEAGKNGWYEILVELLPGKGMESREQVRRQVERLFHANRNLCEGLDRVLFIERKPLILAGDIETEPEVDATRLLVGIYWEALQFFVPGIKYRRVEEALADGKSWEEILDGPDMQHWVMEEDALGGHTAVYSLSALYRKLKKLRGVKDIRSLAFREGEHVYTDFIPVERAERSYTVQIPVKKEETGIRLLVGGAEAEPEYARLTELLFAEQAHDYGRQNCTDSLSPFLKIPAGKYRNVYVHDSVRNDFPECYGINKMGIAPGVSEHRQAQAGQLGAYILMFDEVFGRGLKELHDVSHLLDISRPPEEENMVRLTAPEIGWEKWVEDTVGAGNKERQLKEKENWADRLDGMYGEDSLPDWLEAYNFYKDSREEILMRRFRFLGRVPEWGRKRFKGIDLYDCRGENVPGIKAYIAALLGFETEREQPVMNVFPMYNLRLVDDRLFYKFRGQLLSHNLVAEEEIKTGQMEDIPEIGGEFTDTDYHLLSESLPLLHYHLLFEGLFREGIRLSAFRLMNLPYHSDRLLMFYHREYQEWINLGRFSSRVEVFETANRLKRFLVMLNRKCETLYVVERLFITGEAFTLTVVLPAWSARFADARFREACEQLVCSRLPAHLKVSFRWLAARKMWDFERLYYAWRKAFAAGEDCCGPAEKLKNIIL